jgi:hypothetical protein
MTEFRGNENEEKALFFVPRVGCIEECQWHSEGTGLSTRAIGHPLPVTACARGGLSGVVTKAVRRKVHTLAETERRLELPPGA